MSKIIPKPVLEQIRDANDIAELIGTYLQIKRAGSSFKALCPFHKEKTPSFHINPQRQIFHCFGCGAGGDVFKFVMQYENVDFSTAARMLAQRAGIRVEWSDGDGTAEANKDYLFKLHEDVAMLFHRALLESEKAAAARAYLKDRDLGPDVVKDFLIGFAPDSRGAIVTWAEKKKYPLKLLETAGLILPSDHGEGYYERFRGRLMFPIRDEIGRVIGFSGRLLEKDAKAAKYVNSPETPLFRKGRVLYALDRARRAMIDAKTALLCEGQIDVIRCHTAGFQNAVAAQGTALTEDHARLIKRYADSVLIVLDADRAGQDAALRSAEVLIAAGLNIRLGSLPEDEDPDSLIRKEGPAGFQRVLDDARSPVGFQIAVLKSRGDLRNEPELMRAVHAVLETIARAPSAVQRDQMLRQAAHELGVAESSLRTDLQHRLRRAMRPAHDAAEAKPAAAPVTHPADEIAVAELLCHHPDIAHVIDAYLPMEYITDAHCRRIVEELIRSAADSAWNVMSALADEDDECRRLAAQVQASPPKVLGTDISATEAAQDLVLRIWRRVLERRRDALRSRIEAAPEGPDRERLQHERKQITLDLKMLQQGWSHALPIIELS